MTTKRNLKDSARDDIAKFVDKGEPMQDLGESPENADAPKKIKVTHYITMDQVLAMDRIRAKRIGAGKSLGEVDKSRLMREALDLLIKQENV